MPLDSSLDRFRNYLTMLARIQMHAHVRQKFDPSDIVQQTLLEAHRCRQQFRGQSSGELAGWLRQILARQLADELRRMQRDKRDVRHERSLEAALAESSLRLGAWLAVDDTSPSQRVHEAERALQIAEALAQLPAAQRDALILQHWQGCSLAQIATQLNRTPAAVAGLLKRGLSRLRTLLPAEEEGD